MTEFEIVTAVMNLVTSHEGVTNTSLSPDQVAEEVDTLRGRMSFDMDKFGLFRRPYIGFTQTIDSLPVKKRQSDNQRYVDIPKLMMKRDGNPAYVYIGGKDNKSPYRIITGDQILNAKHDQFIGKLPTAHYNEGHIEFFNVVPNYIKMIAVWEDPGALEELGVWDTEVNDYPFPAGMIDELIGKTANSYINTMYRVPITPNTQSDKGANTQQQGNARR